MSGASPSPNKSRAVPATPATFRPARFAQRTSMIMPAISRTKPRHHASATSPSLKRSLHFAHAVEAIGRISACTDSGIVVTPSAFRDSFAGVRIHDYSTRAQYFRSPRNFSGAIVLGKDLLEL